MKNKGIEIICIIDRSGSMATCRNDAIGGFNTFIEEQKKTSKKVAFSAMFFNAPVEHKLFYDGVSIQDVEPLTDKTYIPCGATALYDAIGVVVDKVLERHIALKTPPKTLLVILTDGEENSSVEYSSAQIKNKITDLKENKKWEVIYLGVSEDKFTQNNMANISNNLGINYQGHGNLNASYTSMNSTVRNFVDEN